MVIPGEQHRSRLRRIGYGFLGALVLVIAGAVVVGVPNVEQSREAAVSAELDRRGWTGVLVDFDGRDALVSGTAPRGVSLTEVEMAIAAVAGVRDVRGTVVMAAEPPAAGSSGTQGPEVVAPQPATQPPVPAAEQRRTVANRLVLRNDGGSLLLRGTAGAALSGVLDDQAGSVFGAENVQNRIEENEADAPGDEWLEMVSTTIALLESYDNVTVRVSDNQLQYSGNVSDDATGATLAEQLELIAADLVAVSGSFDVATMHQPIVVLEVVDGVASLSGRVESEQFVESLTRDLAAAFISASVDIETGATAAKWVSHLPLQSVPRAGTYTVVFFNDEATLEGAVVSNEVRSRVVGALRRAGFDVFDHLSSDGETTGACTNEALNTDPLSDVLFGREGTVLQEDRRATVALDDLALRIGACEGVPLTMLVHTDARLGHDDDHELSHERAGALLEALSTRGVDTTNIWIVGIGSDRPIANNSTSEGRAQNRRVEFRVTAGGN